MSHHHSADPRLGTDIGAYHIDGLIGEGGMGKVYLATKPDGTRVALKLVKEDYARDETFRRRFYREARIAQSVKHENVVPMLSSGEVDGLPYMAQRFVDGMALDKKIRRDGPLDVASAVRICTDVAAGLEALWAFYQAQVPAVEGAGPAPTRASRASLVLPGDPLLDPDPIYQLQSEIVYGAAREAVTFLLARYGERRVVDLLRRMHAGKRFPAAFHEAIGIGEVEFAADFRHYVIWQGWRR